MKKYSFIILFIVVAAAGLFWGIGNFKSNVAAVNDSAEEVKIGMNLELTGTFEYYGISVANGALLAFEEINQAGGFNGIKIVPLKVDNVSDPVRSAFLANILAQEGVVSVIGPSISDDFIQTIPAAMRYKIPAVSATATADEITVDRSGNAYDYVFRINFNSSSQADQMVKFALNNLGAKNAVVVRKLNNIYSNGLAQTFMKVFKENGGNIVDLINYTSYETNFEPYLRRIQRENFDIIYLPGYDSEAANFIKQARELGITQPILGGEAYDTPELFEIAGASVLNDVYYTTDFLRSNPDPKVQNFIAAYKEKYGVEPFMDSARGYDSAYFIVDAMKRAGSDDPQAIRDAMASTENFTGVTGTFSMDEEHNPIKTIYIIGLENGIPTQRIVAESTQ
ncbi:ABC transporter substrate-binding protein [Clostridium aminobutyricum]|uniref:ABC transporter substrate-binding protein n=1 Tax=Clostridium aminobutyricum TaxID=33953 RepID=A0A939D7W8_CLOAM|nr:ABC transporter substrate-binding protein [Clostridium aminobutyricum]MBN7772725.1 ABC transporter substrate-binding protein [Clostridium aminobutyricum]